MRTFILVTAIAFVGLANTSRAEEETAEVCHAVMSVYGEDICESEVSISQDIEEKLRSSAEANDEDGDDAVENLKNAYLFRIVWDRALKHKFGEEALSVSDKEVKNYLKAYRNSDKKQYQTDKELIDLITGLLKKNDYPEREEAALKSLLIQADLAVESYDIRAKAVAEEKAKIEASEYKIAKNAIRNWKVKKLLRDEYGGRIVLQEEGLEPIDGYKALLEEVKGSDDVVLQDDDFENVFEGMEGYIARGHVVIEEGSENIENYFASPSWAYDENISAKAAQTLKESILSLQPMEKEAEEEESEG